jgi:hypothetical protein
MSGNSRSGKYEDFIFGENKDLIFIGREEIVSWFRKINTEKSRTKNKKRIRSKKVLKNEDDDCSGHLNL